MCNNVDCFNPDEKDEDGTVFVIWKKDPTWVDEETRITPCGLVSSIGPFCHKFGPFSYSIYGPSVTDNKPKIKKTEALNGQNTHE